MALIQPLNPYNSFVDQSGKLTRDGYDFLYNLYLRVGGSLSNLNAATLQDGTWQEPGTIGSVTPNTGKFTTIQATVGAVLAAASATSLTVTGATDLGASSSGVILQGTNTNNNAAAGKVGEYATQTTTTTALTTNVVANATSVSLTAGDWDVSGTAVFSGVAASTSFTGFSAGVSTTSATLPATTLQASTFNAATVYTGQPMALVTPVTRISLAATTTVYLTSKAIFTVSTASVDGRINARRVR